MRQNENQADNAMRRPRPEPEVLAAAMEYLSRGWNVIPLRGKQPGVAWKPFQDQHTTNDEIANWFGGREQPHTNLGIVTGEISRLVVVDCDSVSATSYWTANFPASPIVVKTGNEGTHHYYRYPETSSRLGNRARLFCRDIDIRADGGYVVAPPSRHPNGRRYKFVGDIEEHVEQLPLFKTSWLQTPASEEEMTSVHARLIRDPIAYLSRIHAVSGQGGHNATYRAACILRDAGLAPEEALAELIIWSSSNANPPWSVGELLHKVQDVYQRGGRNGSGS